MMVQEPGIHSPESNSHVKLGYFSLQQIFTLLIETTITCMNFS